MAIADFDKAIQLNPHIRCAYLGRGMACGAKGDRNSEDSRNRDRGIADFERVIELDPQDAETYFTRQSQADRDQAVELEKQGKKP